MSSEYDDQLEEWQSAIDEIQDDIDLEDPMLDADVDESQPSDDMEVTEITITRPILMSEGEEMIEATKRLDRADGGQIAVTVRKHFRCPSCHYFPQHEADRYEKPPEIKSWCRDCEILTCTECRVEASCCQRDLCSDCSEAFITEDGPLCSEHREDAVKEREFQREMQIREQDRADRELELKYDLQYLNLELEARIKEQQQRLQTYVEQWKHIDRIEKNQIQKKKVELNHMLERRKQALQEFKTEAEVELRKEKQALDLEQHRDQHQLNQRKQRLKEQQAEFDQYIQEERLEIQRAQALLRAKDSVSEEDLRRIKKAANKLDNMNSTPAITV
jgi:hypothetical protein